MGRDVKRDLVQPSLLDRLTDDEPRSSCEAQDKRSFSVRHSGKCRSVEHLNWRFGRERVWPRWRRRRTSMGI
ncbi:hypothetical protein B5E41_28920 [Rhizobium esperanzae]|uniref:Uncharacterized protein n=1 Tax=Rhizobium esperanzae TaxID=1967781 RepID=A0A246DLF6_9HYPH|nr:hypothetical protein B5E41_28920 [Rhizobium esperanzae]